jgi:hypothetical protein
MEEQRAMNVRKAILSLAVTAGFCLPVAAQTQRLWLEIPFNFVVAGKAMPAGRYEVRRVWTTDNITWTIQGEQAGTRITTTSIESPRVSHSPGLMFIESGGTYSLTEIWESEHTGQAVPRPSAKPAPTTVGGRCLEISVAE